MSRKVHCLSSLGFLSLLRPLKSTTFVSLSRLAHGARKSAIAGGPASTRLLGSSPDDMPVNMAFESRPASASDVAEDIVAIASRKVRMSLKIDEGILGC